MPVLSFHCVITDHHGPTESRHRQLWIKSHDFRGLAVAAAEQLAVSPAQCQYMLLSPHAGSAEACTLLKAVHAGASALVGPMGGPAIPGMLSVERAYSLNDLLERVGCGPDAERQGLYTVRVAYAGPLAHAAWPPVRETGEPVAQYRTRCVAAELVRLERARQEGFHVIRYEVPPTQWRAEHLEDLLGRAYRLLPIKEPRWHESGAIRQEKSGGSDAGRAPSLRYTLEVARGDFVACLRLPAFPVRALADWLKGRDCEINLCHPMVKLQYAQCPSLSGLR
jgi:hypothetical protein